jgi:hypothetical protein
MLLSALHLLALVAWWRAPLPPLTLLPVVVLLALYWLYQSRCLLAGDTAGGLTKLSWDSVRGWRVFRRADGWRSAALVKPVFVTSRLVIVSFRLTRFRTCSAIIVGDRISRQEFRRLRVRLLQSAHEH